MIIISTIKIIVLLALCVYSSVTDIKKGVIKNYSIAVSVLAGILFNAIEWIFISSDYLVIQIVNIAIVLVLSILLYTFHIWAAGDCKLMIAIALLIPYDYYLPMVNQWFALIFVFAFSFAFGYIFLIVDSVYSGIKRRHVVSVQKITTSSKSFLKKYVACVSYIALINQLLYLFIPDLFTELRYVFLLLNICVSFVVSGTKFLQNKYLVISAALAVVIIKVVQHQIIINKAMLLNYVAVFFMLLLRLFIDEYNYKTIPTKDVKKGMILSASTILLFYNSRVKGLPHFTTEDLRSRLTQENVDSILRWEHSKYGSDSIQIVRKIPFAIFISLGTILFLLFGVFM